MGCPSSLWARVLAARGRAHGVFHYLPEVYRYVHTALLVSAGHFEIPGAAGSAGSNGTMAWCRAFGTRNGLYPRALPCLETSAGARAAAHSFDAATIGKIPEGAVSDLNLGCHARMYDVWG